MFLDQVKVTGNCAVACIHFAHLTVLTFKTPFVEVKPAANKVENLLTNLLSHFTEDGKIYPNKCVLHKRNCGYIKH